MQGKERCLIQPDNGSGFAMYAFTPTLFCLLPPRIKCHFSMPDRVKLVLRAICGYTVYYQTDGEKMVSYCFLKRNYFCKYAFLKNNDVLINPYYVTPDYRGRGLGGKLIKAAIADRDEAWETVYAVVKEDNLPSIRTFEKLNFVKIGFSDKSGWSHKLTDKQTKLSVFCLTRSAQQEKKI